MEYICVECGRFCELRVYYDDDWEGNWRRVVESECCAADYLEVE